jgi:hypothetical protein
MNARKGGFSRAQRARKKGIIVAFGCKVTSFWGNSQQK